MNSTTPTDRARAGARRPSRIAIVAISAIVATALVAATVVAIAAIGTAGDRPKVDASSAPATEPAGPEYTRPAGWSPYRPAVHLTPAEHWMNDPQRPFWLDGRWHYYYLYNADYPDGNGTEWYHATSTDLVHWRDEGVAIEKYRNGLGDILTGSAVVDSANTAGFGEDAVVAMVTQQHDGVQRQSLFVSTDGGYTFASHEANPVMENPGAEHWRDPKVVWDEDAGRWLMTLAEGHKIGFYASPDLVDWEYLSGFERDDLGILECPDLFRMSVDGDPSRTRWVLLAGVNGERYGMTTGTAYWTGSWDGTRFAADEPAPRWLDRGSDFYATVTWDDPRLPEDERLASRSAIGWLNNWAYAGDLPTDDWHGGADSVVRDLRLVDAGGRLELRSTPTDAVAELEGPARAITELTIPAGIARDIPQPTSDAYRLRVSVAPDPADPARETRLRVREGDGAFATVGVDFTSSTVFIARDADAAAARMPDAYRVVRTAPVTPAADGSVTLDVIVDASSVEVFAGDGEAVLSSLVFGAPGANRLSAESVEGATRLDDLELVPLAVAPVERASSDRRR